MKELIIKISWKKLIFYTISIMIILIVYDWITVNYLSTRLPEILYNIIFVDFDDTSTIWAVQSTIAAVSITIVSLIIGSIDTKKYGYSITESMMIDTLEDNNRFTKLFELKYWDMVILVIILSLGGIYFVTHENLTGSSTLFFISGGLIILILSQTLKIMLSSNTYKANETKEYIIKKAKNYIKIRKYDVYAEKVEKEEKLENEIIFVLEKVYLHSIESINKRKISLIIENVELYLELIDINFYKANHDTIKAEQLKETVKTHIFSICREMIKNNLIKELKIIINNILKNEKNIDEADRIIGNIIVIVVNNMKYAKELESLDEYNKLYEYIIEFIKKDINNNTLNGEQLDIKTSNMLEQIYINSLELIKSNYINQVNKNLELFLKLLDSENYIKSEDLIQNKFNLKKDTLSRNIGNYVLLLCEKMIESNYIQEVKLIISKINLSKNKIILAETINRDILISLIDSVRYITNLKKLDSYNIYRYIYGLHINKEIKIELLQKYYYVIKQNLYLSSGESKSAINEFIEFIAIQYVQDLMKLKEDVNNIKDSVCINTIIYIGKECIIEYYSDDLTELINRLCKHCGLLDERDFYTGGELDKSCIWKVNEIFAMLNVYIYYLFINEDNINIDFKKKVKQLLNVYVKDQSIDINSLKNLTLNSNGEYLYYYDLVNNSMDSSNWKFMQTYKFNYSKIEDSIKDYFMCYAAVFLNEFNFKFYLDNIKFLNEEDVKLWLSYFDECGNIKNKDMIASFCNLYEIDYCDKYNGNILYLYLIQKYKNIIIDKLSSAESKKNRLLKNADIEKTICETIKKLEQKILFNEENIDDNYELVEKVFDIDDKYLDIEYNIEKLIKKILQNIEKTIKEKLLQGCENMTVNYKKDSDIRFIISRLKSDDLNINTCINGKLTDNMFIYNSLNNNIAEKSELEGLDSNINILGYIEPLNQVLYLDSSKYDVGIKFNKLEIKEYTEEEIEEEIEKLIKKFNGKYLITSYNIELTREEMKKYIKYNKNKVYFSYYFKSEIKNNCGIAIKIISGREDINQ